MTSSNNQLSDHLSNPSNLYFLHPNENPALILVSPALTGPNYHSWARAMTMALQSKNKIKFINETLPKPARTDPMSAIWQKCNTTVISWINHSLSQSIAKSIIWIDTTVDI